MLPPQQATPDIAHAVHILKAEILSADWSLSPRRNNAIAGTMVTFSLSFHNRRYAKGVVAMTKQLLDYLDKQRTPPAQTIDLLKELMAHIITFYEQETEDRTTEKNICARCLARFKKLNIPLKSFKNSPNKFATAGLHLKQDVERLQSLAPAFNGLSSGKQIEAMLTLQSLIAETKELQKLISTQI